MKVIKRILSGLSIAFVVCFIGFAVYFVYVLFGTNEKSTQDIAYYRAVSGQTDGAEMIPVFVDEFDIPCPYDLPLLEELEPYVNYRFDYTAIRESVFESHAYTLIVSYDAYEYSEKTDELMTEFVSYEGVIPGNGEEIQTQFEMDGFKFRAIDGGYYPKQMMFIGLSDTGSEIAVIYFFDDDLDYIEPSLSEFLKEYTGWKKLMQESPEARR